MTVYIVAAILISVQQTSFGTHVFNYPKHDPPLDGIIDKPETVALFAGQPMTDYNNYRIFKFSFGHLVQGKDLYGVYPGEHWDFYKYSPTFALLMGAIAWLPDVAGLSVWNLLNALALFFAIRKLPFSVTAQCLLLWFIANDLFGCFANAQSNGIMAGLVIAAYVCMQGGKPMWATLWLVLATFIKVYGAIGFCLFLFYPDKVKFILYAAMWTIIFAALPLLVTPFSTLTWQYHSWLALMKADASTTGTGLSVAGWLQTWFGLNNVKSYVTMIGMVLFVLPFARFRLYRHELFKLLVVASMLIWVIVFNHKAESPTYVIAVAGVGIWYFAMPRAGWRTALLFVTLVFTSLSTTDLFPPAVRTAFIYPYDIKAVPCIIVWFVVFAELMLLKPGKTGVKAEYAETGEEFRK